MYDWSSYFEDKTLKMSLKGITQMHHFHFSWSHPGKVKVWFSTTDTWRTINLLKDPSWRPSDFPQQLIPPRLSVEREQYLYEKTREFCPAEYQDLVCPQPTQLLQYNALYHIHTTHKHKLHIYHVVQIISINKQHLTRATVFLITGKQINKHHQHNWLPNLQQIAAQQISGRAKKSYNNTYWCSIN